MPDLIGHPANNTNRRWIPAPDQVEGVLSRE
jgi:hypothetical protein